MGKAVRHENAGGNLQPPDCGEFATFVAGEFARFASMRSG